MKHNELRLFVSSTFIDLQPEREQLIKKVFPQVRALCRERGVEFTEIDLRWGITEEEAHSGKTVRICIEELDRCNYFLGIMGKRYGWAPGEMLLEKDPELARQYPWIEHYAKENKSITDMEFSYGAILKRKRNTSHIYEQLIERKPEDSDSFEDLRARIASAGIPHKEFSSPEELGEKVLHDIIAMIDRDWPAKKEMSPAEKERSAHEAFALNRTRSYISHPEYYDRFEKFINSSDVDLQDETRNPNPETRPLILWGRSGFGKSALMAHLTSEYKAKHPNAFVIRHFTGAASGASSSDDLILHVMTEIKERYEITDELPQQNLQEEFPNWLARIPEGGKLVLAIDAVNQLSGIGPEMHWLPEFIPARIRLIISTTPELPLDQLRKRNWQEMEIMPLDAKQRLRITKEFLSRYHKTMDPELLHALAEEPQLESPLFLRTVLEELRIFGSHSALEKHLATYLQCRSEAELFQAVLARMEHDHGAEIVRKIMSALWASRYGLSETELLEITGFSRLAFSEFLFALDYHLMQRSGLYTFFHNYLREAVEIRYLNSEESKKEIHRHLASYFSEEPYDNRRRDEEPWQWLQAEDSERFKDCITDIPMLEMLLDESRLQEIIGYWVELQKNYDLAVTYHTSMEDFKAKCEDEAYFAELSGKLGNALVASSSYKEAEVHLQESLELQKKILGEESLKAAESMNYLSVLYYHTGNFDEAEKLLQLVIIIREKLLDKNDPLIAKAWSDLGVIFYSQGKLDEAEKYLLVALDRYQTLYKGNHPEIAATLGNLGAISYFRKKYDEAIDYYKKSINMDEQIYGSSYITNIPAMANLALAYMEIGTYEKAEPLLLRTLYLNKSIYGKFHVTTSNKYMSLGVFYARIKNYRKAIEMQSDALEISNKLLGKEHYSTINIQVGLGINLYRSGKFDEGRKMVEHYLPLLKDILGANHQMFQVQENNWNQLIKKL